MKKQRVSFGACFMGKAKDFVLVSGGYGIVNNVIGESEIFNVNDNFWTVI